MDLEFNLVVSRVMDTITAYDKSYTNNSRRENIRNKECEWHSPPPSVGNSIYMQYCFISIRLFYIMPMKHGCTLLDQVGVLLGQ